MPPAFSNFVLDVVLVRNSRPTDSRGWHDYHGFALDLAVGHQSLHADEKICSSEFRFINLPVFKVPLEGFQFLANVLHLTEKDRRI